MKIKELRIGNYVKVGGTSVMYSNLRDLFLIIKEIYKDKDNNYICKFKSVDDVVFVDWVEPIKLTDERLLELGFEKISEYLFRIDFDEKYLAISLKDYSYGLYSSKFNYNTGTGFNSKNHRIKFVHQLQNLAFAHGKELSL